MKRDVFWGFIISALPAFMAGMHEHLPCLHLYHRSRTVVLSCSHRAIPCRTMIHRVCTVFARAIPCLYHVTPCHTVIHRVCTSSHRNVPCRTVTLPSSTTVSYRNSAVIYRVDAVMHRIGKLLSVDAGTPRCQHGDGGVTTARIWFRHCTAQYIPAWLQYRPRYVTFAAPGYTVISIWPRLNS